MDPAYGVFDLFDPLSLAAEMETFSRGSKLDALPPPSYADLLLMDPSSLGMMPTADEWAMLEEWGSSAGLVGAGVFGVGMFSPLAEIDDGVEPVQEGGGKAKKSRSGRALKPTARATEDADFEPEEEETTEGGAGGGSPGGVKRMTRNKNANATNAAKHSSTYRGVTKHRWTGRFEAHLWDSTVARGPSAAGSKRPRGRQIYLGGWGEEEQAARAYDMAAIKHVTQHHQHEGKWEARIGRVEGTKHVFLGSFSSELEAARAYDRAALHYRGPKAVTNFAPEAYSAENAAAAAAAAAEAGAEVAAPGMVQGVVAAGVAWGMGPTEIDMLGVLLLPAGAEKPASGVA